MGTSGNRKGYKVFSFNTSVRNPKRNRDFLEAFKKFNGKLFDTYASHAYLCELVKLGVYKFTNVSAEVKTKWENDIELTRGEVEQLIQDNPQATGEHNRVMTSYMGSLKHQGFLKYSDDPDGGRYHIITITKLGEMLLDEDSDEAIVYTKAMIGLHSSNPARTAIYNRARPFLNTLFVIKRVNDIWSSMGNEPKGVLRHEFATFILSMKDCDYESCARDIIEYRKKYRFEIKLGVLNKYLKDRDELPLVEKSLVRDYPDDVFRKFEMTGLIMSHGAYSYVYYNFSQYNLEKINQILEQYKDYSFIDFNDYEEYEDFLANVVIPWEDNESLRWKIAKTKADYLGIKYDESVALAEIERQLDRIFYSNALGKATSKYSLNLILRELMILAGVVREKSKFEEIGESLRLEYLLALSLAKLYGTEGLVSNIIYNEEGSPMHFALGNKCDMVFYNEEGSLILEPTMICSRDQQGRNETTSITRHTLDMKGSHASEFRTLMIAPRVHQDTIDYFTYRSSRNNLKLISLTIAKVVGLFAADPVYKDLIKDIDLLLKYYDDNQGDLAGCAASINSYRPDPSVYEI